MGGAQLSLPLQGQAKPHAAAGISAAESNTCRYRVTFYGVWPSLLPSGNDRQKFVRSCETRQEAESLFDEAPGAYQLDRWEADINGWVMLAVRDRA